MEGDQSEYLERLVSGASLNEFANSFTTAVQQSPSEIAKRLHRIRLSYMNAYGLHGYYKRLNSLTVAEILRDHETLPDNGSHVVERGEVDGVKYELRELPE